ncbi:MAG: PrgI family protein [Candidatus Gracilibacteria bacterium]|nr:PrgI family protein [Candidatus Gracilibacteria bacterium]
MQYKIPVQIENEDPIFLGLSLKQLFIIMIGFGIAYSIFQGLTPNVGPEIAAVPAIFIALITLVIALFKHSEMTFIPYILNLVRQVINSEPKKWQKGVDSYQPIDIGFVSMASEIKDKRVETSEKVEKINTLQEKLKNI